MDLTRRSAFKYSIDELVALVEECHGRRSFKLSGLSALADEQLGRLIPAIMDASNVRVDDGDVVVLERGRRLVLFRAGAPEQGVWARIDGRTTVRAMADALALEWGEGADAAFARVRAVVLALVRSGVCLPRNALE